MLKKRLSADQENEDGGSQIMSDLALSMVGVMVIAFTGYILKFRSEAVAQAGPDPQQTEQVITQLRKQLEDTKRRSEELEKLSRRYPSPSGKPQLFGLNGPMTNVVFCLDLSGSMVGQTGQQYSQPREDLVQRFGQVKGRLKKMIRSLEFQNFSVIGFGGDPNDMSKPRLVASTYALTAATSSAREYACGQIDQWQAVGGTPTLPALKAAYAMQGVEHVVLLTDGLPTLEGRQDDVLRFVSHGSSRGDRVGRSHSRSGIVIDVIGIGDQSSAGGSEATMALIDFTRHVADATGGFFQAW